MAILGAVVFTEEDIVGAQEDVPVAQRYQELSLGPDDWAALKGLLPFLSAFKESTELVSGSKYPTLSMVGPMFRYLLAH